MKLLIRSARPVWMHPGMISKVDKQTIWQRCIALILLGVVALGSGCTATTGPYRTLDTTSRSPLQAERLTQEAVQAIDRGDSTRGERLLREALTADLYYGPAHNNLGVLYLSQGKLYEAATEFEWARKLMPGHPDPRLNLAMTLEQAGHIEPALNEYRAALDVWPGHIPTLQAYTRCQLRNGQLDESLVGQLEEVSLRGETDEWRSWGRLQLSKQRQQVQ